MVVDVGDYRYRTTKEPLMNRQDHLAHTTSRVDLAFSALPDAPVVTTATRATPVTPAEPGVARTAGLAPVRRARHRLAAGLQRTATWLEPTHRAHSAV